MIIEMAGDLLDRTAVLYTREDHSVFLRTEHRGGQWRLIVLGPYDASEVHEFTDRPALQQFQASFEQTLADRGFRLNMVAERRISERPPSTSERRRRT